MTRSSRVDGGTGNRRVRDAGAPDSAGPRRTAETGPRGSARNEFEEAVDRFVEQARETIMRTAGPMLDRASGAMERGDPGAAYGDRGRPGPDADRSRDRGALPRGAAAGPGPGRERHRDRLDDADGRAPHRSLEELDAEVRRLKLAARDLYARRRRLFDRKLWRNPRAGRIGGVCAGLADYFEREAWFIRIVAVTGAIFFPTIVIPAYLVAYVVLDPLPRDQDLLGPFGQDGLGRYGEGGRLPGRRRRGRQRDRADAEDPRRVLRAVRGRLRGTEHRVRRIESYVTSPRFQLDRELRAVADGAPGPSAGAGGAG